MSELLGEIAQIFVQQAKPDPNPHNNNNHTGHDHRSFALGFDVTMCSLSGIITIVYAIGIVFLMY